VKKQYNEIEELKKASMTADNTFKHDLSNIGKTNTKNFKRLQ